MCVGCFQEKAPCQHHRGPNGKAVPYTGYDVYEPGEAMLDMMRCRWAYAPLCGKVRIWECFGRDPRAGIWLRTIDDGDLQVINVSERAMERTVHRVEMTFGAWNLLAQISELGRLPTASETSVLLEGATQTLVWNGLITEDGKITDRGHDKLSQRSELEHNLWMRD